MSRHPAKQGQPARRRRSGLRQTGLLPGAVLPMLPSWVLRAQPVQEFFRRCCSQACWEGRCLGLSRPDIAADGALRRHLTDGRCILRGATGSDYLRPGVRPTHFCNHITQIAVARMTRVSKVFASGQRRMNRSLEPQAKWALYLRLKSAIPLPDDQGFASTSHSTLARRMAKLSTRRWQRRRDVRVARGPPPRIRWRFVRASARD